MNSYFTEYGPLGFNEGQTWTVCIFQFTPVFDYVHNMNNIKIVTKAWCQIIFKLVMILFLKQIMLANALSPSYPHTCYNHTANSLLPTPHNIFYM